MDRTIHDTKNDIIKLYTENDLAYGQWGWCSLNKAGCLVDSVNDICQRVDNPVCVEIGVYGGKSIFPVAMELKRHGKGIVHAIDPWSNQAATIDYDGTHLQYWSQVDLNKIYDIFIKTIGKTETENYINVIKSTSDDAPEFDEIDLVYIDGQHTAQSFKDVDKYASKVKIGGYCYIDDYNWGEVKGLPYYLESLGFYRVHTVDVALIYKRASTDSLHKHVDREYVNDPGFYMFPPTFDWGELDFNTTYQIQREILHERVYRWFRDVKEGDLVVDLGSSVGPFAASILGQKPGQVICVEPNSRSRKSIFKNCVPLANENNVSFRVTQKAILSEGQQKTGMITDEQFSSQTFKEFVSENNISKIDFLKMDIEGGEYEVFSDENIDFLVNNVEFITLEVHLKGPEFREKFIKFRDKHLSKFKAYKLYGDGVDPRGEFLDFTNSIYDNKFIMSHQREMMLYLDNGDNIKVEEKKNIFELSLNQQKSCWIVDNFYKDPDSVRKFALEQDYHNGGIGRGYIGNRTHQQFLFPGLKEKFEEIMGKKITLWKEHGMNGRFQWCISGQPQVWHCDSQMWGGMLYLTPNAPVAYGTTMYGHKQTKARTYRQEGWRSAWDNKEGDPHLDGSEWEPVDVFGNVYNRLVIFDAACIHSSSGYFGTTPETGRLWQMFFFDTES